MDGPQLRRLHMFKGYATDSMGTGPARARLASTCFRVALRESCFHKTSGFFHDLWPRVPARPLTVSHVQNDQATRSAPDKPSICDVGIKDLDHRASLPAGKARGSWRRPRRDMR